MLDRRRLKIQDPRYREPLDILVIHVPRGVRLRDLLPQDVEDIIHWRTVDTEWMRWDAPWEVEEDFDPEAFRMEALDRILAEKPLDRLRRRMEVEIDGIHVGLVSHYAIDASFEATEEGGELAVGIDLIPPVFRGQGFGFIALALYIRYLLEEGIASVHCQTWSGNHAMIRLAEKLGFVECHRKIGYRCVRGQSHDGLTFRLDMNRFEEAARKGMEEEEALDGEGQRSAMTEERT